MHKAVFDTNVFISALITPRGKTASLFLHADKYKLVVSLDLLEEIAEAMTHPHIADKYAVSSAMVQDMLMRLKDHALLAAPKDKLDLVSGAMDNHLLALAKESKAGYLVTGDREMLDLKRIGSAAIVSPAAFLKELEKNTRQ